MVRGGMSISNGVRFRWRSQSDRCLSTGALTLQHVLTLLGAGVDDRSGGRISITSTGAKSGMVPLTGSRNACASEHPRAAQMPSPGDDHGHLPSSCGKVRTFRSKSSRWSRSAESERNGLISLRRISPTSEQLLTAAARLSQIAGPRLPARAPRVSLSIRLLAMLKATMAMMNAS